MLIVSWSEFKQCLAIHNLVPQATWYTALSVRPLTVSPVYLSVEVMDGHLVKSTKSCLFCLYCDIKL